jgi:succinate-semialdehyde dehydrogenase/glutarate-semialdehyde dehydrogenase
VAVAVLAKFRNDQACTAADRFIVHQSIADEFANHVTGCLQTSEQCRHREKRQIGPPIDDKL